MFAKFTVVQAGGFAIWLCRGTLISYEARSSLFCAIEHQRIPEGEEHHTPLELQLRLTPVDMKDSTSHYTPGSRSAVVLCFNVSLPITPHHTHLTYHILFLPPSRITSVLFFSITRDEGHFLALDCSTRALSEGLLV